MNTQFNATLVIHGGAGVMPGHDYTLPADFMREILTEGGDRLRSGESALELVVAMVTAMEACGLFVAGKGSCPNQIGEVELDASVMCGHNLQAGAVAAARNIVHPIQLAQAIMQHSPHVMLAGPGAESFADQQGLARVKSPESYYRSAMAVTGSETTDIAGSPLTHGTVGAVALDQGGRLAAATSTGGTLNKQQGRVGDTPVIGAGTWADSRVAVSSTGEGEFFLRLSTARDIAARVAYQGTSLEIAAQAAIGDIGELGADGGVIAVDDAGHIAMPFNSGGMKRGYVGLDGIPVVKVY